MSVTSLKVDDPDWLEAEIARLTSRPYPVIGVPMYLATEDLTLPESGVIAAVQEDDILAEAFEAAIETLQARRGPAGAARHRERRRGAGRALLSGPAVLDPGRGFGRLRGAVMPLLAPSLPMPASEEAADLSARLRAGQTMRAINFHSTPRARAAEYRALLGAASQAPGVRPFAGPDALFAGSGTRCVVPILFEGFRNNFDVLLPILEQHGLKGWFFVPPAFLNTPPAEQRAFAARQSLHDPTDDYPGERIALGWEELREVRRRGHFAACHTRNHTALDAETPDAVLTEEIVLAAEEMADGLGERVDTFCYLRGAPAGLNPRSDRMLVAAGFRFLLSNLRLQKLQ